MNNLEQYLAAVPAETAFVYFFSHGCEICPAMEYCHAQAEGTCCHGNFMAWAKQKTPLENNKTLIKALRDEFAPRIRELCADDRFDCDKLCAGNILTAQCIVFQAADALESQAAEIADLRAQLAEKDKQVAAAVEDLHRMHALCMEEGGCCSECGSQNDVLLDAACDFCTGSGVSCWEGDSKLFNPAGEYAVKFAENHGMSIDEAMEQPMVKARFSFFADTGM